MAEEEIVKVAVSSAMEIERQLFNAAFRVTSVTLSGLVALIRFMIEHRDSEEVRALKKLNKGGLSDLKTMVKSGQETVVLKDIDEKTKDYIVNNAETYGVCCFVVPDEKGGYNVMTIPSHLSRMKALIENAQNYVQEQAMLEAGLSEKEINVAIYNNADGKSVLDNNYDGKSEEKDVFISSAENSSNWKDFYERTFKKEMPVTENASKTFVEELKANYEEEYGIDAHNFVCDIPNNGVMYIEDEKLKFISYHTAEMRTNEINSPEDMRNAKEMIRSHATKEAKINNQIERFYGEYSSKQQACIANMLRGEITISGKRDYFSEYADTDVFDKIMDKRFSPSMMAALYHTVQSLDEKFGKEKTAEIMNDILSDKHLCSQQVYILKDLAFEKNDIKPFINMGLNTHEMREISETLSKEKAIFEDVLDKVEDMKSASADISGVKVEKGTNGYVIDGKPIRDMRCDVSTKALAEIRAMKLGTSAKIGNINVTKDNEGFYKLEFLDGKKTTGNYQVVKNLQHKLSIEDLKNELANIDIGKDGYIEAGKYTLNISGDKVVVSDGIFEKEMTTEELNDIIQGKTDEEVLQQIVMTKFEKEFDSQINGVTEQNKEYEVCGGTVVLETDETYSFSKNGKNRNFTNIEDLRDYIGKETKSQLESIGNYSTGNMHFKMYGISVGREETGYIVEQISLAEKISRKNLSFEEVKDFLNKLYKKRVSDVVSSLSQMAYVKESVKEKVERALNVDDAKEYEDIMNGVVEDIEEEINIKKEKEDDLVKHESMNISMKTATTENLLEWIDERSDVMFQGDGYKKLLDTISNQIDPASNKTAYSDRNILLLSAQVPQAGYKSLTKQGAERDDVATVNLVVPEYYSLSGEGAYNDIMKNTADGKEMYLGVYRFTQDKDGNLNIEATSDGNTYTEKYVGLDRPKAIACLDSKDMAIASTIRDFHTEKFAVRKDSKPRYVISDKEKEALNYRIDEFTKTKKKSLLKSGMDEHEADLLAKSSAYIALKHFGMEVPEKLEADIKGAKFNVKGESALNHLKGLKNDAMSITKQSLETMKIATINRNEISHDSHDMNIDMQSQER